MLQEMENIAPGPLLERNQLNSWVETSKWQVLYNEISFSDPPPTRQSWEDGQFKKYVSKKFTMLRDVVPGPVFLFEEIGNYLID